MFNISGMLPVMRFLKKLQNLPEKTRKVILWSTVVVLALILLVWWVNSIKNRVAEFRSDEFMEKLNLSSAELPEIPEFPEEGLQTIEQTIKELETNAQEDNKTE